MDGALAGTSIIDLLPSFLVTHTEVSRRSQIVVACAFNEVTEKKWVDFEGFLAHLIALQKFIVDVRVTCGRHYRGQPIHVTDDLVRN